MKKSTAISKKSLVATSVVSIIVVSVVLGLANYYGYLGAPLVNPNPDMSFNSMVNVNVKNPKYDALREWANRIVIDYPYSGETLAKRYTYVMPRRFDGLFFLYDPQTLQPNMQMEVTIVKADGTQQTTGVKPIETFAARATPFVARGMPNGMRGDLGSLVMTSMYRGVLAEFNPEFIVNISVSLSWPRERISSSVMATEAARRIQFSIVPMSSLKVAGPPVENVRNSTNVFSTDNR